MPKSISSLSPVTKRSQNKNPNLRLITTSISIQRMMMKKNSNQSLMAASISKMMMKKKISHQLMFRVKHYGTKKNQNQS